MELNQAVTKLEEISHKIQNLVRAQVSQRTRLKIENILGFDGICSVGDPLMIMFFSMNCVKVIVSRLKKPLIGTASKNTRVFY